MPLNLLLLSHKASTLKASIAKQAADHDFTLHTLNKVEMPWPLLIGDQWIIIIEEDVEKLTQVLRTAKKWRLDKDIPIVVLGKTVTKERNEQFSSMGVESLLPATASPERLIAELFALSGHQLSNPQEKFRCRQLKSFVAATIEAFEVFSTCNANLKSVDFFDLTNPEKLSQSMFGWIFLTGIAPRIFVVEVPQDTLNKALKEFYPGLKSDSDQAYKLDWTKEFVNIIAGQLRDRFVGTNAEFEFSLPETDVVVSGVPIKSDWPAYRLSFDSKHGEFSVVLGFATPGCSIRHSTLAKN